MNLSFLFFSLDIFPPKLIIQIHTLLFQYYAQRMWWNVISSVSLIFGYMKC